MAYFAIIAFIVIIIIVTLVENDCNSSEHLHQRIPLPAEIDAPVLFGHLGT